MKFRTKRFILLQNTSAFAVTTISFKYNLFLVGASERRPAVNKHDGCTALRRETNIPHRTNTTANATYLKADPAVPLIRSLKGRSKRLCPRIARNVQTKQPKPYHRSRSRQCHGIFCFLYPQTNRRTLDLGVFPLHSFPGYDDSYRRGYLQNLVQRRAS